MLLVYTNLNNLTAFWNNDIFSYHILFRISLCCEMRPTSFGHAHLPHIQDLLTQVCAWFAFFCLYFLPPFKILFCVLTGGFSIYSRIYKLRVDSGQSTGGSLKIIATQLPKFGKSLLINGEVLDSSYLLLCL